MKGLSGCMDDPGDRQFSMRMADLFISAFCVRNDSQGQERHGGSRVKAGIVMPCFACILRDQFAYLVL